MLHEATPMPKTSVYFSQASLDRLDAVVEETGASRSQLVTVAVGILLDPDGHRSAATRDLFATAFD